MEKMTNVKALAIVLDTCNLNDEVKEKLEKMKAQFEKKNSTERKPTATQTANEEFKAAIADGMVAGTAYTVSDLIKAIPEIGELTNQRVSALLRAMSADGIVVRTVEKRKAYFSLSE